MRWLSSFLILLAMQAAGASGRARSVQERFLAPCCWRENLAVHRSPTADELRADVARLVAEGKSETEIVNHYVARYGERILREPRGKSSVWLRLMPLFALGLGAVAVIRFLQRNRVAKAGPADLTAQYPDARREVDW
ncbi:MAG: cytochrome c-type biogenesis protein CcmH [Bryobacterales bacterium]|nr:cytochrome c-type biogenesis protein CcmH [Bryobacterales bacterium]